MNDKFFLFKNSDTSVFSSTYSNDGIGISVLGIPASSLSYMSAKSGSVVIFFNNATPYEENSLLEGQSFQKTNVEVKCEAGKEYDLIEAIMNFISRKESSKTIMRFDASSVNSTFKEVVQEDLLTKVHTIPIDRGTQGSANVSGTTIAGVDFRSTDNLPLADYNETATAIVNNNDGFQLSTWQNDTLATGGTDYNLSGGTYKPEISVPDSVISTKYVDFYKATGDKSNFSVDTDISLIKDFTLYFVCRTIPSTPLDPIFGDDISGSETSYGPFIQTSISNFIMQFSGSTTDATFFKSDEQFPYVKDLTENSENCLYVFVVRRDADKNIVIYNKYGKVIGFKKADKTTDGSFDISYIGGILDKTKMALARVGIVEKDLGDELCRSIALSLNNRYLV